MSLWLHNFPHQTWQNSSWISLATTLRKAGLEESQRCSPTAITGSWPHWWCAATWRRQRHDVSAQHLSSLSHCCVLRQIGDTDSNLQHKDLNEKASWYLVVKLRDITVQERKKNEDENLLRLIWGLAFRPIQSNSLLHAHVYAWHTLSPPYQDSGCYLCETQSIVWTVITQ